MLPSKHVYLVGYRGSGKSSVARELAARLDATWTDTDDEIERLAGKSIAEIFAEQGEPGFRELESQAIREASKSSPRVIALGGGAVVRSENRELIRRTGNAVWLDASPEVLIDRIDSDITSGSRRPRLTDRSRQDEVRELMQQRKPWYREVSDLQIDVSQKTVKEVVAAIIAHLNAVYS